MKDVAKEFIDRVNSLLENDPDIEVNSVEDIQKLVEEEYKSC